MRLPRRVPWSSLSELELLCSWIYNDEDDTESKVLALNRLIAWRAITALPHALEATLSLLTVITHDKQSSKERQSAAFALNVRQSYSAALIRLVNGLVDPLQLGAYARSINSIAAQIGLPTWLVDLRHAATHEDLPSLESLRQGATESMTWLLHNYFMPTLSPTTQMMSKAHLLVTNLTPLPPLLKRYKLLLKSVTKDKSLRSRLRPDILKCLRDIERWIGEAKVAGSTANYDVAFDTHGEDSGIITEKSGERWALDLLCKALNSRGCLIPVSAKKRLKIPSELGLPETLLSIWLPLLNSLTENHPDLPSVLVSHIILSLFRPQSNEPSDQDKQRNVSFDMCMVSWAIYIIENRKLSESTMTESATALRWEDIILSIVSKLSPFREPDIPSRKAIEVLVDALCKNNSHLRQIMLMLLPIAESKPEIALNADVDISVMEDRLGSFLDALDSSARKVDKAATSSDLASAYKIDMPNGWRFINDGSMSWKTCPIGAFVNS